MLGREGERVKRQGRSGDVMELERFLFACLLVVREWASGLYMYMGIRIRVHVHTHCIAYKLAYIQHSIRKTVLKKYTV